MKIIDRYGSAISTRNLKSEPDTMASDADVLGAFGLAARKHPLAVALTRMFLGGDKEAKTVSAIMTRMLVSKAYRDGEPVGESTADLIAGLVLQWHRDRVCRACGGHGFMVAFGSLGESRSVVGDECCPDCQGRGSRPFEKLFPADRRALALWLRDKVERETSLAGPSAMAKLADQMRF